MPDLQLKITKLIETLNAEFMQELSKAGVEGASYSSLNNLKNLDVTKLLDTIYLQICYCTIQHLAAAHSESPSNNGNDPYTVQLEIMEGLLAYVDKNAGFAGLSGRIKKQILDGFFRSSSANNIPEKIKKSTDLLIPHDERNSKYYKDPKTRAVNAFAVLLATSPGAIADNIKGIARAGVTKPKRESPRALEVTLNMDLILRREHEYGTLEELSPGIFDEEGANHMPQNDSPLTTQSETPTRVTSINSPTPPRPASAADMGRPPAHKLRRRGSFLSSGIMKNLYRRSSHTPKSSEGTPVRTPVSPIQSTPMPSEIQVPRLDLSGEINNNYKESISDLQQIIQSQREHLVQFDLLDSEYGTRLAEISQRITHLPKVVLADSISHARTLTRIIRQLTELEIEINAVIMAQQKEALRIIKEQATVRVSVNIQKSYAQRFLDLVHKAIASLKKLFNSIKEFFGFELQKSESENNSLQESSPSPAFLPGSSSRLNSGNKTPVKHILRPPTSS